MRECMQGTHERSACAWADSRTIGPRCIDNVSGGSGRRTLWRDLPATSKRAVFHSMSVETQLAQTSPPAAQTHQEQMDRAIRPERRRWSFAVTGRDQTVTVCRQDTLAMFGKAANGA